MNNIERYPGIIQKPRKVIVYDTEYTVYTFRFKSITELYKYLKSDPKINIKSFADMEGNVASISGEEYFAGIPYNSAVEQLVNATDPNYKEFLKITSKMQTKNLKRGAIFQYTPSVAGGIIRPHALATGDPHIYGTTKIIKPNNTINIHTITSYLGYTTKTMVYNKAVILTNIIHALEAAGLNVKVNAFSTATEDNELIEIILDLKRTNTGVNYQALYRALCNVEFLRRILFRVRETSDVKNDWSEYGRTCSEKFNREYLKIKDNELYFGQPDELGISGHDIAEDFENAVKYLKLEKKIDIEKAKKTIKENTRC